MQRATTSIALLSAALLAGATVSTSFAATPSPYNATFQHESTVFRACPPGLPANAICFTGADNTRTGFSNPPTPPDTKATEDFAGFIDQSKAVVGGCPDGTTGLPDHNIVSITTYAGSLFLTTDGLDCPSLGTDEGTWTAHGGTGIFQNASGTGHVHTQATGGSGTATNPITSFSTYTGTLTLQ